MGYQRDMLNWLPNHEAPLDSYFLWNEDVAGGEVPYIAEPADDNVYVCRYTVNIYDTLGTEALLGAVLDVAAKTMVVGRLDLTSSYDYEVRITVLDADEGDGLSVSVRTTTSAATVTATPVAEAEAEVDRRSSLMEWGSGPASVLDENANSIPRFSHVRFELQAQEGYAYEICGITCTGANIETSDFSNFEHPLEYTGGPTTIQGSGGGRGESIIDPFIWLFDTNKNLIAFDDDGGVGINPALTISDLPLGSYSFIVADYDCEVETGFDEDDEDYDILDYEDLVECVEDAENWGDGIFMDLTRTIDVMFNER